MKRIYAFGLLLSLLSLFGFHASAELSVTVKWNIANSISVEIGAMDWEYPEVSATATEQTFTLDKTWGSIRIHPKSGYQIVGAEYDGTQVTLTHPTTGDPYINLDLKNVNGKILTVNVQKIARNDSFTIDIINGATSLNATFHSGYTLDLKNGDNNYAYNADYDGQLTLHVIGEPKCYFVKLNGTEVEVASEYSPYYYIDIEPGSVLEIQVFERTEDEKKECSLTFEYGPGMEASVSNVYDKASGKMYVNTDFEDGVIHTIPSIVEGAEVKVNLLNEDYTVNKVIINGVDKTSLLQNISAAEQTFTFTITENTTIRIEGKETVWPKVTYTGYISIPDGVIFTEQYEGDVALEYTSETPTSASINGKPMPEGTKMVNFQVSTKRNGGQVFFRPKSGYFITEIQTANTDKGTESSLTPADDGYSFYMLVEKMSDPYPATVTVTGSSTDHFKLQSSSTYATIYGNPVETQLPVDAGTHDFTFSANFENPFDLTGPSAPRGVFLDGAAVNGSTDDNEQYHYSLSLYAPAQGETSDAHSEIAIYFSGMPSTGNVSLDLQNGAMADLFYSPVKRKGSYSGQQVLVGTLMTVKPSMNACTVIYNGEPQELNEDGEFQFNATAGNTVVTVTAPQTMNLGGMTPVNGTSVGRLTSVTLLVPMFEDGSEFCVDEKAFKEGFEVTFNNKKVAGCADFGEATPYNEQYMALPVILDAVLTDDGRHYIKVPAGVFIQKKYDAAKDAMVTVPGGYVNALYSGNYKIDSTLASALDTNTITPANGSTVKAIENVNVVFDLVPANAFYDGAAEELQFVNGDKTITAAVVAQNNTEHTAFDFKPLNEDGEQAPITEPGEWILTIPANFFMYEDKGISETVIKITVNPNATVYPISPENGSTVDNLSEITVTFPDVDLVEYNEDINVTLVGPETNLSTNDVRVVGNEAKIAFRNPAVEGEFTLTIPAGAFTLDGEASVELIATYNFKKAWELSPAPGSTVEYLNSFTLSFPEASEVEFVGSGSSFNLGKADETYAAPPFNCVKDDTASVPTFLISLPETAQEPPIGDYTFTVDAGTFSVDGNLSPEITANYTVDREASLEYILSPEHTAVYGEYGFEIAILFDESMVITTPTADKVVLTFDEEVMPTSAYMILTEENRMMFSIYDPTYSKEGTVKVSIEAGAFNIGKTPAPAIEAEWQVVAPKQFVVELSYDGEAEDNKVNNLGTILLHFPEATSAEVFDEFGSASTLRSEDYSYSQKGVITIEEATTRAVGVTAKITFDPAPTEVGNYTLNVRGGCIILDGVYGSPAIEQTYFFDSTFTGIESIFADENGNVTVFTLDGRVVLNNVPAAQLRELEKGLYIINGKKTIVK